MVGQAVFFSGPIGVGKTTLGRAVAAELRGSFIDGDDYSDHSKPWFGSSLSTSRKIADATLDALAQAQIAVIAYPLRCTNFVYFQRRIRNGGHRATFVTLRASAASILAPSRGRLFDADERDRAVEMITQGYAHRPFSDFIVDTDVANFSQTVATLVKLVRSQVPPQGRSDEVTVR